MAGQEVAISLAIAGGAFALIVFNIMRVSGSEASKGNDQSGAMLLQNFLIAIAGCAVLFWYWGYFAASDWTRPREGSPTTTASADEPMQDCSDPELRRAMQALRYCINSDSCANTAADIEKVLAYRDACPPPPRTPEQRYPDGCDIYNPVDDRYYHLEPADCVEYFDST